jgi:hypothetical protein
MSSLNFPELRQRSSEAATDDRHNVPAFVQLSLGQLSADVIDDPELLVTVQGLDAHCACAAVEKPLSASSTAITNESWPNRRNTIR